MSHVAFNRKTVRDIDVHGKTVLVRADYNVPLDDQGGIADDYRIRQSLPTLQYLLERGAKVVICSHLGRPRLSASGAPQDSSESLFPVAKRLQQLLKRQVNFVPETVGPRADKIIDALKPGEVVLLENLRYSPLEEANDDGFARQLAAKADVFVQDGFGVVHRAHASTDAITKHLPAVSGLLLEKEVVTILTAIKSPSRPLMAVVGGAKIEDKIDVLRTFIDIADFVAVGGAMANTFLKAKGIEIGDSLADDKELPLAREIMRLAAEKAKRQYFVFALPYDGVVAHKIGKYSPTRIVDWNAHVIAEIEAYPKRPPQKASRVLAHEQILDIGPFSASFIAGAIQLSNTVIWNGTMGVAEQAGTQGPVGPYAQGTELLIEAMTGHMGHRPFSLVGGGDTVAYIRQRNLTEAFNHVSTGGGASLELMAGRKLPGIEALRRKEGAH